MKEDILEQLVEDYFQREGYLTLHNVKFRPRREHRDFKTRQDSSHSDIDILGYNPHKRGTNRVVAISCKSWQGGFPAEKFIQEIEDELKIGKKTPGKEKWKFFRELTIDKWSEAFRDKIEEKTGSSQFTYCLAVTQLKGNQERATEAWQNHKRFKKALKGNPIKIITVQEILDELWSETKTTMAESEIGRLLQVIKASGWETKYKNKRRKHSA